jgi:hypothetical protein
MLIEGTVNPPTNISFSDGSEPRIIVGKTAELMVAGLHGNLYTNTYRGYMYHGYITTASAIPITSTTAPTMILWNPYGSGINCVLVHYCVGWAAGTNVEGNVQLAIIPVAGDSVKNGAPISAFTTGATINGMIGLGTVQKARFGSAATVVAATRFLSLGLNIMVMDTAKATPVSLMYDFNGTVILPEGTAVFDVASSATVATYNRRLSWYEFPM